MLTWLPISSALRVMTHLLTLEISTQPERPGTLADKQSPNGLPCTLSLQNCGKNTENKGPHKSRVSPVSSPASRVFLDPKHRNSVFLVFVDCVVESFLLCLWLLGALSRSCLLSILLHIISSSGQNMPCVSAAHSCECVLKSTTTLCPCQSQVHP